MRTYNPFTEKEAYPWICPTYLSCMGNDSLPMKALRVTLSPHS